MGFFADIENFINDVGAGIENILTDTGEILETAVEVGIGFAVAGPVGAGVALAGALDENIKDVEAEKAQGTAQTAQSGIREVQLELDATARARQTRSAVRQAQVAEARISLAGTTRGLAGSSIALGAAARVTGQKASAVSDIRAGRLATEKLADLGADLSAAQQQEANIRADQQSSAALFNASLFALSAGAGGRDTPAPIEVSTPV
jgi:hypothetical protein